MVVFLLRIDRDTNYNFILLIIEKTNHYFLSTFSFMVNSSKEEE